MPRKRTKKELRNPAQAGVKKEMAKPRMAKSARTSELNLDTARIPDQPSTSLPGTVDKIIPAPRPSQPEKAQIAVAGPDNRHRDLRIRFHPNQRDLEKLRPGMSVSPKVHLD
jgi:hypothetical protein